MRKVTPEDHVLEYLVPKYLGSGAYQRKWVTRLGWGLWEFIISPSPHFQVAPSGFAVVFVFLSVCFQVLSWLRCVLSASCSGCLLPGPPCHYYGPCSRNSKLSYTFLPLAAYFVTAVKQQLIQGLCVLRSTLQRSTASWRWWSLNTQTWWGHFIFKPWHQFTRWKGHTDE